MNDPAHLTALLRMIATHDGAWTWYQLDRAMSVESRLVTTPLTELLRNMETQGLIRSAPGPNQSQPTYWITDVGKERLSKLDVARTHD